MNYKILRVKKAELHIIEPLWSKLNNLHLDESPYFKDHYKRFSFSERIKSLLEIPEDNILIEVVKKDKNICGYSVSSIKNEDGEIESLFVSNEDRGKGLGEILVKNSIDWMKKRKCKKIQVSVSYGHESVFGFYKKLGLYPRLTYLQLKD